MHLAVSVLATRHTENKKAAEDSVDDKMVFFMW
jgi:hypothetical protein